MDTLIAGLISVLMVIRTTLIFYEVMRIVWEVILELKIAPRMRIILVVLAIFTGHTAAVWAYGVVYWLLVNYMEIGVLTQGHEKFMDAVYFSAVTYSSLGFGDVTPTGAIRMLCGVEVLNGLVLIGWSVSFTYLAMEKFWDEHRSSKKKVSPDTQGE